MDDDRLYEIVTDAVAAALAKERGGDEVRLLRRFVGGEVAFRDGEGKVVRAIPVEALFKKVTSIREKLRVLEQKVNNNPKLDDMDRGELQGLITRCYGSLTTFNLLFRDEEDKFKGSGGEWINLVVIGGGSGGVRAARMAAGFGAKVLLVERAHLGGTCVNVGCIPKKLFHYAATFADAFEDAAGYGWTVGQTTFDWATLIRNKDKEIARLNAVYAKMLASAGVEVVHGFARLVDPHKVAIVVDDHVDREVEAENILLAVGGRPWVPPFPGQEFSIVSDQAFHMPSLPKRILIVGGGYIACEFAGIFRGLGSDVTLSVRSDVLTGFDEDIRSAACEGMTARGVKLHRQTHLVSVTPVDGGLRALFHDGSAVDVDLVFTATGRLPATNLMGLEEVGVAVDEQGAIIVDPHYRTVVPSIFAVGDCTNRLTLTPVALAEGMAVVRTLFGGVPSTVQYDDIPTSVFSQPEIGTVGLCESDARKRYPKVDIYRARFRPLLDTLGGRDEKMMMKIVVDGETDRVLGIHVVGPEASEIIQGFAVAVRMGAKKADLDRTIGIHPTAAEELVTMRTKA